MGRAMLSKGMSVEARLENPWRERSTVRVRDNIGEGDVM